jgi:hypothetical protein
MRSSTSASRIRGAISLLLTGCVLVASSVEIAARLALDRVSKIQRRTVHEYSLARTTGTQTSGRRHMLVVGNSLLDEGVQFDHIREAFAREWDTRRFVVERTFFLDWYYGLKRLFNEGARPDVVVLMLSTLQWMQPDIRGDYSAYYLVNTRDLPALARELDLNATQTTSLFFAGISKFWGVRAEMRNFVLGRLMPELGRLMDFSSVTDPRRLVDAEVERIAGANIARLKTVVNAHGSRLVVLLPPLLERNDGSAGFLRAARAVGVATLQPVASGTFGPQCYRDAGFHLNAVGAAAFTDRLITALRTELPSVVAHDVKADAGPGDQPGIPVTPARSVSDANSHGPAF